MFNKRQPLKIFLLLLLIVFLGELGIMYLLDFIQNKSEKSWLEAIVDSTLLVSLCIPFFWYFFVKPLQLALQLESVKSHMILEMAEEGIASLDSQGNIQSFNRAAQRIFGYTEEDVINKNFTRLMPSPKNESYDELLERYQHAEPSMVLGESKEMQGLRKDGTLFSMKLTLNEVKLGDTHWYTALMRDISEQKLAQQRIEHLAHYDALTHLPNRSLFFDRLNQSIITAKRHQHSIALLFLDLDGFKQVNDSLGHHFGDLLLVKVAERLSLNVRESDTLARLGGDEFTLILNDTHERVDVAAIAEKIIQSINEPFDLEGNTVHIGVSIGIANYPVDADTKATLIIVADRAMYAAKKAGKNTYRFGSPVGDVTRGFPVLDPDA